VNSEQLTGNKSIHRRDGRLCPLEAKYFARKLERKCNMNFKARKTIAIMLTLFILIVPNITLGVNADILMNYPNDPDLFFYITAYQYIIDNYPADIDGQRLITNSLKGMLQGLDPYSNYYTPEEAAYLYSNIYGELTGIGIYMEEKDSYIHIFDIVKGSPSEKAGLQPGDKIVSIDGQTAKNMALQDAKKLLQGETGTVVKLEIKRPFRKNTIIYEVTREKIEINPVDYGIKDGNIGYIELKEFNQSASRELAKALEFFDEKKIDKIILDLRDNGGGLLSEGINVSRFFVPAGPIVHVKEKNTEILTHVSTNQDPKYNLVLLVNENTASASEIVAGAVKDTKAGIIIGTKTFGKGIVQSLIPLAGGGMLKMTTAQYLTPNKNDIHGVGIQPDIVIKNNTSTDRQLNRAVSLLQSYRNK